MYYTYYIILLLSQINTCANIIDLPNLLLIFFQTMDVLQNA